MYDPFKELHELDELFERTSDEDKQLQIKIRMHEIYESPTWQIAILTSEPPSQPNMLRSLFLWCFPCLATADVTPDTLTVRPKRRRKKNRKP